MKIADDAMHARGATAAPVSGAEEGRRRIAELERSWLASWSSATRAPSPETGEAPRQHAALNDDAVAFARHTELGNARSCVAAASLACEGQRVSGPNPADVGWSHSSVSLIGTRPGNYLPDALPASSGAAAVSCGLTSDRSDAGCDGVMRVATVGSEASIPFHKADTSALIESGPWTRSPLARQDCNPLPSRTLLQVALTDSTAQVSVRDPSLSERGALATSSAIAAQLLGSNVRSVRVYVNGALSQYSAQPPSMRVSNEVQDAGTPSQPPFPLERK
jgi:hypothetical protein